MQGAEQPVKSLKSETNCQSVAPGGGASIPLPCAFERWTLLKQIARGGMGEVFLASTRGIEGAERPCVVKIIRREHAEDKSFLARFFDEARIQAQLQHPGIAQVLEASSDEQGKPYVVVEYVEGRNLAEVRARAQQLKLSVAWADAVAFAVALGEALMHVHERTDANGQPLAIVHRDLSPQNVMVGYGGDVKVIDFGTARGENRRCHTVAGIVFAKPGYVAPEVANNTPGGVPADLYAFGIMFWELVAGRRFLTGEAREHLAAVGAGQKLPELLAEQVGAPDELDRIIAKLTAVRIEDRYASAREATTDLIDLLKRAPTMTAGERGVRPRLQRLMQRLYPAEPGRSRAEFAELIARARRALPKAPEKTETTPPAEREPGMLAGTRYRLGQEVGRGGMGVVYEAVHVDLARTVAIKVLPRELASQPEFGERFRSEARAIASLQHENLVRLYDFGISSDGQPFYAMERLEGESLEEHLTREKVLDWREAFRLGIQACRAVQAAHDAGVIHRDIKPGNLFLTRSGTLKLLDFGIAKLAGGNDVGEASQTPTAIALAGTPEYMAPEQIAGGAVDHRCDVYALGVVLYELVTGTLPYAAESTATLLDVKTRTEPARPGSRAPKRGLTNMVDDTLMRSLEREPEQRFSSADEMRKALEDAIEEPLRQRRRRRRLGFATVGLLAIGIATGAALAAKRPDVRARAELLLSPVLERLHGLHSQAGSPSVAVAAAAAAPVEAPAAGPHLSKGEPAAAPEEEGAASAENDGKGEREEPELNDEAEEAESEPSAATAHQAGKSTAEPAEKAEPEAEPESAPATGDDKVAASAEEPAPAATASSDDKLAKSIAEAEALIESGKRIKGLNQLRRIGRNNAKDARALKAWSEGAAHMKAWGEAVRVARQWASFDRSSEARLHLARMERAVGHRKQALRTLARLAKDEPGCEEARALLKSYRGDARVAMQP